MRSRIARVAITVVSFAGLVLLGLLICSLKVGSAKAQRIDSPFEGRGPSPTPVNSPPAVRVGNRYPSTRPTTVPPLGGFDSVPDDAPLAVSMQPIVVAIKEGPQLRGEPVELSALQVKTIFGPVSIPLERIAGVRTADDSRQPATICLSNGDSLTGFLATDSITIKTEWGSATIARDHIVSIVTKTEPVTWQQHEGRWRIIPVEPITRAADADVAKEKVREVDAAPRPTQFDSPAPAAPQSIESDPIQAADPSLN